MMKRTEYEFLLKDFEHWNQCYMHEESVGERRVQFLITLTAAVLAGLVTYTGGRSLDEVAPVSAPALAVLLILGVFTLLRVHRRNRVVSGYIFAMRTIRRQIVDPSLAALYLSHLSAKPSRHVLHGGLTTVVSFLNAAIAAALVFVVGAECCGGLLAALVGLLVFLVQCAALAVSEDRLEQAAHEREVVAEAGWQAARERLAREKPSAEKPRE